MRHSRIAWVLGGTALLAPLLSFAQEPQANFGGVGKYVQAVIDFIDYPLIPLIFALALFMFLWGLFNYFFVSGASDEGQEKGRQLMLWAVIAFVMMVSIWGLVNVIASGLGFSGAPAPSLPSIPGASGSDKSSIK